MQVIALAAAIDGGFASIVPQLQVLCEEGPFVGGFHAIAFSATANAKVLTLPSDLGFCCVPRPAHQWWASSLSTFFTTRGAPARVETVGTFDQAGRPRNCTGDSHTAVDALHGQSVARVEDE